MATIAEIREKYPQYSDMPDAALADALHSKFYSDIPKTDFYTKVGLNIAASTGYGSAVPQVTPEGKVIRQPDAIPGDRPSMSDVLVGTGETARALIQGIPTGIVAPIAGVARSITGGQYGTQEGVRQGQETAGRVQQSMSYQPTTPTGQAMTQAVGEFLEPLGAIPFSQGATAAALAPSAIRQAGNIARTEAGYVKNAIDQIPSVKAAGEARIADSFARAPQIDAAKLAQKYSIALDPAESNPTLRNRVRGALVGGGDLDVRIAKDNEKKWTNIIKKDLGVGDEVSLTNPKIYDEVRARDDIAKPYEAVRNISNVRVTPDALGKLDELRAVPLYGDTGQAAATNAFLDTVKTQLQNGGNGTKLLKSIQQMRQEGQNVLRAERAGNQVTPAARMEAEAKMNAAKVLESMIDDNIPNIQARDAFIKARTRMAQTYDMESATDFGTGQINPNVFGKLVSEGKPVTGVVADIGKIVSVYPEIAVIGANAKNIAPKITRAAPLALAGSAIGGAMGGPVGYAAGLAIGAGVNEVARAGLANRMLSPSFQSARAVPKDYRPQQTVNNLRPVEPGQSNIVPFNPVNALVEPEIRPNFVFGQPEPLVDVQPVRPGSGPRQIGMDSPADVTARLRAEDARRARMAQMAEAEGLAAESRAPRAPTSGEVLFDLDPVTGQLRPASQGIRGATPETFQDYTATLRSAIDKMSGKTSSYTPTETTRINTGRVYKTTTSEHKAGEPIYSYRNRAGETITEKGNRAFDMTAAEKVAFDKTRVDLAEVAPGFKALNDRAIADKMMDRNWVQETLQRAREKDAAFAEIESRARSPEMMGARAESAKNAELARQAADARDRVKSSIELLEEQLRSLRPDNSRKTQGPKTRNALRNSMRGDDETINKLVP